MLGVVDTENEIFTRHIWNHTGQLVGYQSYNWRAEKKVSNDPKGRYWTWLTKTSPEKGYRMFGMIGSDLITYGDTLYLVEGQFEQATAYAYGLNCVAMLCNNPKHLIPWLYAYPGKIIALAQNDKAGLKLGNIADKMIILPRDLDEMTKPEVMTLLE